MANEKTTKISDLHPKDNKNITIYPNTTSEAIIDKVSTLDSSDKVPTSNAVKKNDDRIENKVNNNSDKLLEKLDTDSFNTFYTDEFTPLDTKTENMNKVIPTDLKIVTDTDGSKKFALFHDSEQISGQVDNIKLGDGLEYDEETDSLSCKLTYLSMQDGKNNVYISPNYSRFMYTSNKYDIIYRYNLSAYINSVSLSNCLGMSFSLGYVIPDICLFTREKTSHTYGVRSFIGFNTYGLYRDNFGNYFLGYCTSPDSNKIDVYKGIKLNNIHDYNYDLPAKNGTFALLSDIWYQYRHTITITAKINDDDVSFCFTTGSTKNTSVDSLQDMFTLFASSKLSGNGFAVGTSGLSYLFNRIDVGTSVTDSYLYGKKGTETTSLAISSLTSITIEDDVTQD